MHCLTPEGGGRRINGGQRLHRSKNCSITDAAAALCAVGCGTRHALVRRRRPIMRATSTNRAADVRACSSRFCALVRMCVLVRAGHAPWAPFCSCSLIARSFCCLMEESARVVRFVSVLKQGREVCAMERRENLESGELHGCPPFCREASEPSFTEFIYAHAFVVSAHDRIM